MSDESPQSHKAPRHVAIIMDGNGRWAKKRLLPRVEGHRAGTKTVKTIVRECRKLGVEYLTLFAFSTENWKRPEEEVGSLMKLFAAQLESELGELGENGVRLRTVGDLSRLPKPLQDALERAKAKTAANTALQLILAVSYGGRDEIVRAARRAAAAALAGEIKVEDINEGYFSSCLDCPDVPDPDLLIRTSDENRISNFLLWELAYSEIVVTPVLWPDFDGQELARCFSEYASRSRRFGLTEEQLSGKK